MTDQTVKRFDFTPWLAQYNAESAAKQATQVAESFGTDTSKPEWWNDQS